MSDRFIAPSAELYDYVVAHGTAPDDVQRDLIEETHAALPRAASMQIGSDQGAFLTMLVKIIGVRTAVEVGTFTGYSSLAIAHGLEPGGRLLCCDVSEEFTFIARRYWQRAGVDDRIELRLAPALETLQSLPATAHLDFAFIDADKGGYASYWAELVPRMRPGGVIAVDNTLWSGRVLDPAATGDTAAIIAFNDLVRDDDRVEKVVLTIGDGLTLARKR
jgi:predicted O-methyltransferase YrrM